MLSLKKKDMVNDFLIQVKQSHLASRKYLLNTYDITNPILQAFSAIDPVARGHTLTFTYLSKLFSHFKLILQDSANSDYFDEIKNISLISLYLNTLKKATLIYLYGGPLYLTAISIRFYQKLLKQLYRYSLGHK